MAALPGLVLAVACPEPAPPDAVIAPDTRAQLAALGYADGVDADPQPNARGVTQLDRTRMQDGYNLYNLRTENRAQLIDPEGNVVHTWSSQEAGATWHHIEMTPRGDLYVIDKDGSLAKLDWDSRLEWRREIRAHHDLHVDPDGVFVLARRIVREEIGGVELPIVEDYVAALGHDGQLLREVPLLPLFRSDVSTEGIGGSGEPFDALHVNTLERLDRDIAGLPTAGDFLICARNLDRIAIVDLEKERVEWSWGAGELDKPHQPSLVPGERVLVFDNGAERGWSRLVEVDPATNRIVWEWRAETPRDFYSKSRGGAQRLPNGNTLVTESNRGHVFEIAADGGVVWEFRNPEALSPTGPGGPSQRAAIYRMTRIPSPWVDRAWQLTRSDPVPEAEPGPGRAYDETESPESAPGPAAPAPD